MENGNQNQTNSLFSEKKAYIETAVLACMMLGVEYIPMIRAIILGPGYFYDIKHQAIFQAICDCYENNPDDHAMLIQTRDMLEDHGRLNEVGGAEYLVKVAESTPSSASWEFFSNKLKELHTKRQLVRCGSEIINLATGQETSLVAAEKAQTLLRAVIMEDADCGGVTNLESLESITESFNIGDHIPTGIGVVDGVLTGLKRGEVTIIAARPGMGKTVLAMDFAINMSSDGVPVMFFSLEMQEKELKQRIVCNQTRISSEDFIHNRLNENQIAIARGKLKELNANPLYIDDSSRLTPDKFHAKMIQYKAKYKTEVAIIDYLTLMQGNEKTRSSYEKFTNIVNELKRITKDEDISLVLVCQLNRGPETRTNKTPTMGDLRDSGAIEQAADVIMMIYREDYYTHEDTGIAEIHFCKARRARPQRKRLRFFGEYTRFEDLQ